MKNILGSLCAVVLSANAALCQSEPSQPNQLSEVYGAWTVRCNKAADLAARQCEITQERRQSGSNKLVVALSYRQLPDGAAQALVVAPFGLRLSEGVRYIGANESEIWSGSFQTCLPTGCISLPQLTAEELANVISTDTAQISFTSNEGKQLSVQIDTNGLDKAWQRLLTLGNKD